MNIYFINCGSYQIPYQLLDHDVEILTPQEIFGAKLFDEDGIIIPCELGMDNSNCKIPLTNLYGINLAQELRLAGFAGPILFLSFFDRITLSHQSQYSFTAIINTIGHAFCNFFDPVEDWISILSSCKTLNSIELFDIRSNYCNKIGLASLAIHDLRNLTYGLSNHKDEFVFNAINKCIKDIGSLYEINTKKKLLKLKNLEPKEALFEAEKYCETLVNNQEDKNDYFDAEDKKHWSILILDDEPEHQGLAVFIEKLESLVEKVFVTHNAELANNLLKDNIEMGYRINVVISDFRLNELDSNKIKVHQKTQGYSFLMEASVQFPYLGYLALSALPRKFLLNSFRNMGIKVDVYSKKDYFSSDQNINILIEDILIKGDEIEQIMTRRPLFSSSHWQHFESFYKYHRRSVNYSTNEQIISEKAFEYCKNYVKGEFLTDLKGYTTSLKGSSKKPENEKYFKDFLEKMACRRAVLWYSQRSRSPIYSPKIVIKFLQGNNYNPNLSDNAATNQINTNLALKLTEFPWNTTVEEKEWLINKMQINRRNIENIENLELNIFNIFRANYKKFNPNYKINLITTFQEIRAILYQFDKNLETCSVDEIKKRLSFLKELLKDIKKEKIKNNLISSRSVTNLSIYISRIIIPFKLSLSAKVKGDLPNNIDDTKKKCFQYAKSKYKGNDPDFNSMLEASFLLFQNELKSTNTAYLEDVAFLKEFYKFHYKYFTESSKLKFVENDISTNWSYGKNDESLEDLDSILY